MNTRRPIDIKGAAEARALETGAKNLCGRSQRRRPLLAWRVLILIAQAVLAPCTGLAQSQLVTNIPFRLSGSPSPFTTVSTWEHVPIYGYAFPAYRASYYVQARPTDFSSTIFYEWDVPSATPKIAGQLDVINLWFTFGGTSSLSWSQYTCNPTPTQSSAEARFWAGSKQGFGLAVGPGQYYVPNLGAYPLRCGADQQNSPALGVRSGLAQFDPAQFDPIALGATVEVRDDQGALLDLPARFLSTVVAVPGGYLYTDEISNFTDSPMTYAWELAGLAGDLAAGQSVSQSLFSVSPPAEYLSQGAVSWPTYLDSTASFSGPAALLRPIPVQAVPEPDGLALLFAGGSLALLIARKRRPGRRTARANPVARD